LVETLSGTGAEVLAATKRILNELFGDVTEATLDREADWCVELYDRPEAQRALRAFRDRRA
jgi:hypothetical protein